MLGYGGGGPRMVSATTVLNSFICSCTEEGEGRLAPIVVMSRGDFMSPSCVGTSMFKVCTDTIVNSFCCFDDEAASSFPL